MKIYQLVCHKSGARSPILHANSLIEIAQETEAALQGCDDKSPLQDLVLVLAEGDGQAMYASSQPLIKLQTILDLRDAGVAEPVRGPSAEIYEG